MLKKRINTYTTSSLGRLFDAVSALLDISRISQFEGQAAMALEFLAETEHTDAVYPLALIRPDPSNPQNPVIVDWEPMIRKILDDVGTSVSPARIAAQFHNTVAAAGVEIARLAGETRVVLSGGCFQNRYLTEKTIVRLSQAGFSVYWHQRVPPNDGGISLGQAVAAAMKG
jgi:hydrogenase maturation protein HypF